MAVTGELSEDGKLIWNGSEWEPFTPPEIPEEPTQSVENSENLVLLHGSRMPFLKERRIIFSLPAAFLVVLFIVVSGYMSNKMDQWCAENWEDGDERNVGSDDGAPFEGGCYEAPHVHDDTIYGYTFIENILYLPIFLLALLALVSLLHCIIWRKRRWNCGNCNENFESENLIKRSKFTVNATSMSTKQITTSSPNIGVGMLGGKSGSFVSIGSSTSHVPTVLGRVSATHRCPSKSCSIINQWQFDTEVQVWTDGATGEVSYDITGEIQLPR